MLKNVFRFFSYKVKKVQNMEQLEECEALIKKSFGRVMRFGIESIGKEQSSSNICHFFCQNKKGQVIGVVKLVEAQYLLESKNLMLEYRLNELPREILPNVSVVVGVCVDPSETKQIISTKLIIEVYQFLIKSGKVMAIGLVKPGVYWRLLKLGIRPFSSIKTKVKSGGYRVPMAQFIYKPNYFLFTLFLFFIKLIKTKKLNRNLLHLVKQIEKNECSYMFNEIKHENLSSKNLRETLFLGVSKKSINQFFANSIVVDCQKGDLILKAGKTVDRCSYFILSGFVLVSDNGQVKGKFMEGDLCGEPPFLQKQSKSIDLIAGCDHVRIGIVSLNALNNITNRKDMMRIWSNISMNLSKKVMTREIKFEGHRNG
ncbi:cyclic nucleotide-binding domain-containing protein [uncultured Shewanella sp.]|uniref:cyclic nucleotide-binding domain-containing protein n=1 Tax=uncultured Shewanella sp. TaxID=173975 RepID=UPI00263392A5|nr:cyclic nucleotide-binding domain-containing protein [uncultured Shewanella sp.]